MTKPEAGGERWKDLAEPAASERDSRKLISLVSELSELLDEKLKRLNDRPSAGPKA